MLIYVFVNEECCPIQKAIAIADDKEEALSIIIKETKIKLGWELQEECEYKKGIVDWGDADC